MKVAYMLGSLNRGGTETLMLDTFRKKELLPDCICIYRKPGSLESDFKKTGIRLEKITPGKNLIKYIKKIRTFILSERIEILHAQQPIDALFALLACTRSSTKVLLTLHGFDYQSGVINKLILQYVLPKTSANVYVSEYVKKYYIDKYKLIDKNQQVIYNGINISKLQIKLQSEISLRKEIGIKNKTILLGMVGNFVPGRDPMTVCRFLRLLHQQNIDVHFVFAGKKSDSHPQLFDDCVNYCKINKFKDKVSFLGSRDDIPEVLQQLDAFIYATDYDTFGIAVVEAMAAGVSVFVNDWEVMKEITDEGKHVFLYETKNEHDLFDKFLSFLKHKNEYQDKTKKAQEFVINTYSIEKHIDKLLSFYKLILSNDN